MEEYRNGDRRLFPNSLLRFQDPQQIVWKYQQLRGHVDMPSLYEPKNTRESY